MPQQLNLRVVKAAARSQFGDFPGVEGFGLGENSLRIYIRNAEVSRRLPSQFQGVPVDFIVTGDITASPAPGVARESSS